MLSCIFRSNFVSVWHYVLNLCLIICSSGDSNADSVCVKPVVGFILAANMLAICGSGKKDVKHMHEGVHDLGGKIDKIYWVLLGTVGAVSLLLLEKVLDKGWF